MTETYTFIVNVEVAIYCNDEWFVIKRSENEEHAPGLMSFVGGKVETHKSDHDVLIENLIREVYEEVGIKLANEITYVDSSVFQTDKMENVIDILFMTHINKKALQMKIDYSEVSSFSWLTAAQIIQSNEAPEWLKRSVGKAEKIRLMIKSNNRNK